MWSRDGPSRADQEGRGWIADATSRRALVPTAPLGTDAPTFNSIALAAGAVFAVVNEAARRRLDRQDAVYAFDTAGRVRAVARGGLTARVSSSGQAVLATGNRGLTMWSVAEAPRAVPVPYRIRNLHARDQSRAAGGRVVVQDATDDTRLFTVIDGSAAPRTLAVQGYLSSGLQWDVAADGSTLVAEAGGAIHVLSLDDGSERLVAALTSTGGCALRTSRHVTAAGQDNGLVRVWSRGRELRLDLSFRQDAANALAISPDERWLAIGTARGVVLLAALD